MTQRHGLVGLWFHRFADCGEVEWQGQVLSVEGDVALVQLYEWMVGSPSVIKAVQKSDLYSDKFALYASSEQMNAEYKYLSLKAENAKRRASQEVM